MGSLPLGLTRPKRTSAMARPLFSPENPGLDDSRDVFGNPIDTKRAAIVQQHDHGFARSRQWLSPISSAGHSIPDAPDPSSPYNSRLFAQADDGDVGMFDGVQRETPGGCRNRHWAGHRDHLRRVLCRVVRPHIPVCSVSSKRSPHVAANHRELKWPYPRCWNNHQDRYWSPAVQ